MAWTDRLTQAAYTSPGGTQTSFDYEDVSLSFDKNSSEFTFPDAPGTYVQDRGRTGRKFPLRIFVHGPDYDLQAIQLQEALGEPGVGTLQHPLYGGVRCVPFGTVTRRDDLKSAASQAVFDVTFWETIELIYPSVEGDGAAEIAGSASVFVSSSGAFFDTLLSLVTAIERVSLRQVTTSLLDRVRVALAPLVETDAGLRSLFNERFDCTRGTLSATPFDAATASAQVARAIQTASGVPEINLVEYRVFQAQLDALTSLEDQPNSLNDRRGANDFLARDLFASSLLSARAVAAPSLNLWSRSDALAEAESVLQALADYADWREPRYISQSIVDSGELYQALLEAVVSSARFLVERAFQLRQERAVTLDRDRTIIDLAAELLGSVDDRLDEMINLNGLTGSQILELPKGLTVRYLA